MAARAEGWDALGYVIVLIYSTPVLAGMAVLATGYAFRMPREPRVLIRTSKVVSFVSLVVTLHAVVVGATTGILLSGF